MMTFPVPQMWLAFFSNSSNSRGIPTASGPRLGISIFLAGAVADGGNVSEVMSFQAFLRPVMVFCPGSFIESQRTESERKRAPSRWAVWCMLRPVGSSRATVWMLSSRRLETVTCHITSRMAD